MTSSLIEGDPLKPTSSDLIAQQLHMVIGKVPPGDGWRILTGNTNFNLWGRLAYRYEIEEK